jgi:galactose mutarotase-like enzyme
MSVKIENDHLIVQIKQKGAELFSIVNKENQLEYMWRGDPAFWGKTSPVLFPIVGTLKKDTFLYKEKKYTLTRHGFARDYSFAIIEQKKDRVTFSLKLVIHYALQKNSLAVTYEVLNKGNEQMYFSLGAHPAFKIPLTENSTYNDYYLEFAIPEDVDYWSLSDEGLIETKSHPLLVNSNKLKLSKDLFYQNALVLKNFNSKQISLKSNVHPYGLDFQFEGFPYFGIWAAKDADFICLEPWCGVSDSVNHDQHLETKEGIQMIIPNEGWTRTWSVQLY